MEIHETGYAWRYIRGPKLQPSCERMLTALAGASMTLVGLLPPICDNGTMLVDGGYCKLLFFLTFHGMLTRLCPSQWIICRYENL